MNFPKCIARFRTSSSDRPLTRSIIRIGVRLTLGRRRSHWQDWLPGLKLVPHEKSGYTRLIYNGADILSARPFSDVARLVNDVVYIVGSGPSIAECDMRFLPDNTVFLLNGAIHLVATAIKKPLAVVIEDERFVWRHFDLIRDSIPPDLTCLLSVSVIRAICEIDPIWLHNRPVVLIKNALAPYLDSRKSIVELDKSLVFNRDGVSLSKKPSQGVISAGSVATTAMQFALATPAKTVGLFGIDISNAHLPRFYESTTNQAFSGIVKAEDRLLKFFALAKHYADYQNKTVLCFSPVSPLLGIGYAYDAAFERR